MIGTKLLPSEPLDAEAVEVVKAEIDRQRIAHMLRVDLGITTTPSEYALMVAKARGDYGYTREHGRLYGAILGVWALLWDCIYGWYDYLSAWNRES